MVHRKIIWITAALIFVPIVSHAFLWFDDDRSKQERYRSKVEAARIELETLRFNRLMDQNEQLMHENRTVYQRSIHNLSAMGVPGLIYGVFAGFLIIVLFIIYLLFRLADSRRRPNYEFKNWQPPRMISEEEAIQNQFKLLGGGVDRWRM